MKRIISEVQGTGGWHSHRLNHYNASDAAAMLGISKYKSRNDLLRETIVGDSPEIDEATQRRFDKGHEYEAAARPWAEEIIGAELYPAVLADDIDGLPLSASFDGLTMMDDVTFEHKTLNQSIAAALDDGVIPDQYKPQMEQGLMISGAGKCLFMASAGDKGKMRFAWYLPDPAVRAALLAGWKQFAADLASYQRVEEAPKIEGKAPETLPALRIELTGMVTASNLVEFKHTAMAVIDAVKTDLQTDGDFADAEKAVKWCSEIETRLDAAKQHALSQTASIDELFRALDEIKELARVKRLNLEKLVKSRKESVRIEIQQGAVSGLREHYNQINSTFAGRVIIGVPADFGSNVGNAMKGKKSIAGLRDAADTALASAKINASQDADRARINLQTLDAHPDYAHLFPDYAHMVTTKAADDFKALVAMRIADHQAKEEKRIEAERARIREEEQAKLKAEQDAKDRAEAKRLADATHAEPQATATPQAPAAIPRPITKTGNAKQPQKTRPTDAEIVEVLALHFRVHESKIVEWLLDMELELLEVLP